METLIKLILWLYGTIYLVGGVIAIPLIIYGFTKLVKEFIKQSKKYNLRDE